jgi:hypothetical protein
MATKRQPLDRPRVGAYSHEAVLLFADLERVPPSRRDRAWSERSRELARLIGLTWPWWRMINVNQKEAPPVPDHYVAAIEWRDEVLPARRVLLDMARRMALM